MPVRGGYLGYTGAELDALYETARQVTDVDVYLERFERRSEEVRARVGGTLDVAYGPDPRERLDVHAAAPGAPAVFFIHGGYWRGSTKDRYTFLADAVGELGAALVNVEYALIPTVTMVELVEQCRRAVAYVHGHADELGLDGSRLHLTGHSAGGHLVAMLHATDWAAYGVDPAAIRGGLSLSGLFDLEPISQTYLNDTLRLRAVDVAACSPIRLGPAVPAPLRLYVGAREGAEFIRQSAAMAVAWRSRGVEVETVVADGHDHYSLVESLGDPASAVCEQLKRDLEAT